MERLWDKSPIALVLGMTPGVSSSLTRRLRRPPCRFVALTSVSQPHAFYIGSVGLNFSPYPAVLSVDFSRNFHQARCQALNLRTNLIVRDTVLGEHSCCIRDGLLLRQHVDLDAHQELLQLPE